MKLEKKIKWWYFNPSYRIGESGLKYTGATITFIIDEELTREEYDFMDKLDRDEKGEMILKIGEPILDEVERKYLSGVIRPFRDRVNYIMKMNDTDGDYIRIYLKNNEFFSLPYFEKDTMYKGMELNKEYYSLEKLGL